MLDGCPSFSMRGSQRCPVHLGAVGTGTKLVKFFSREVMTGVFCNSAIKAAESDHDLAVQSLVQTRKEMAEQVEKLFCTIDERGSGQVTISEFERNFDKDAVKVPIRYFSM